MIILEFFCCSLSDKSIKAGNGEWGMGNGSEKRAMGNGSEKRAMGNGEWIRVFFPIAHCPLPIPRF